MTKQSLLKENERLDDLQFNNLHLIQHKNKYCFTSDAVALANFVKCRPEDIIADFGSGSGIIGILAGVKNNAQKVYLIELQEYFCHMAQRSLQYNNLTQTMEVINADIKGISKKLGAESVSVVVCNPPYKASSKGLIPEDYEKAICRHEITIKLEDIIYEASKLLKFGGAFYTVNKEERLADIICLMRKNNIEPKMVKVLPSPKGSSIILVKGVKGSKSGSLRIIVE